MFTLTYFLLGCQSVLTQTNKQVESQDVTKAKRIQPSTKTEASANKQESTHTSEGNMSKNRSGTIKEYGPLALFKELAIDKIRFNFEPQALLREDYVNIQIILTDTGSIDSINIIESSGNKLLEKDVFQAIHKAAPLPLPSLSSKELEKAKTLIIKFPMDLH